MRLDFLYSIFQLSDLAPLEKAGKEGSVPSAEGDLNSTIQSGEKLQIHIANMSPVSYRTLENQPNPTVVVY